MKHTFTFLSTATISLFLLGGAGLAEAKPLSASEALQRLESSKMRKQASAPENFQLLFTANSREGIPAAYVFEETGKQGFIILSADDCAAPILGYSDNGSFNPSSIPPGLRYMLDFYSQEIAAAQNQKMVYRAPNRTNRKEVKPLVKTQWNQSAPYNDLCPVINDTTCVTGCVATSTSQVLNYHQWPDKGVGSATVKCDGQDYTVDFDKTHFDWSNMLNSYGKNNSEAQDNAVATLMYAVGVAVDMEYGTEESSADAASIPASLISHFRYDKACHMEWREYHGLDEWENIIYTELKEKRPVIYNGQSDEGGHSFVCDGYSSDGYFHINWGWGGMSDGYFLLTALDPESQGIGGSVSGFNASQSAVVGIQKERDGSEYVYTVALGGTLTPGSSSQNLGGSLQISGGSGSESGFFNFSSFSIDRIYLTLECKDSEGHVRYFDGEEGSDLKPFYGIASYNVTIPSDLNDGSYTLRPVWSSGKDGKKEYVQIQMTSPQEIQMTVSEGMAQFSATAKSSLKADITHHTPLYSENRMELKVRLTNNSGYEFYGGVAMGLFDQYGNQQFAGEADYVDVLNGENQDIVYVAMLENVQPGDYVLAMFTETGNQISEAIDVTVNPAPQSTQYEVKNFRLLDQRSHDVDKHNLKFSFSLECTEGYFAEKPMVCIFHKDGGYSLAAVPGEYLFLVPGESQKCDLSLDFAQGIDGETYMAAVFVGEQQSDSETIDFTIGESGIGAVSSYNMIYEYYSLDGIKQSGLNDGQSHRGVYIRVALDRNTGHKAAIEKIIIDD